ncbi:hypothetical protein DICPUDRAFT_150585 [Dictyostelium purpureum]|uniref:Uncharacterized protein n=1 Tax=Dictyostelium purpureum TaxID=5786 RepID=F0ZGQ1_DICPU|nr:uncharacterized protein DICPUDRAFT_150585 [Dictyostelium purpureum]EGC36885.1 hypothetical protein DICPUDRAFT_150585 [Dictyostelium purpureum]|eukprot:XP_003286607.1 hypothetical protein DICPUDRAFT_150585 [Dictyostelium purpureum]
MSKRTNSNILKTSNSNDNSIDENSFDSTNSTLNNSLNNSFNNSFEFKDSLVNPSPIKKVKNLFDFSRDLNEQSEDEEDEFLKDDDDIPKDKDLEPSTTTTIATTPTTPNKTTNNFLDFTSSFQADENEGIDNDDLDLSVSADDILLSQFETLKSEWDSNTYKKSPPIVLKSVFHFYYKDSEKIIQQLKKKGLVRVFQILTSLNDYYLVLTSDFIQCIEKLKTESNVVSSKVKPETLTNNIVKSSSPIKSAPIDTTLLSKQQVLDLFISRLIPNFSDISISKFKLQQVLQIKNSHQIDNIVTILVQCGLLLLKEENIYYFSTPGTGGFCSSLIKGRKEIVSFIDRLKYKEILKSELLTKRFRSKISVQLLYKDLLGSSKIKM